MHDTKVKEDISVAYITAVCAVADIWLDSMHHDEDSTDVTIKKFIHFEDGSRFRSSLRIQLKCTSSTSQYTDHGDRISYVLKVKNFNDLCTRSTSPVILCLLVLPEDEDQWVLWSPEELMIKGCMYWAEFSQEAASSNAASVTVNIDKNHVINAETLLDILERIAKEEWP